MRLPALAVAFFVSGAAALVYQVAWQRILALHSGVGIYSVALIVAAFLGGLGVGSHLGGVLSARLEPVQSLRAFAWVELAVGGFGAFSCTLYYDLLGRLPWLYHDGWRAAPVHFLALLPPTLLMGMSLPFLVRAAVRDAASAGRTIGILYGINMLGAGVGALATPWVLIRLTGIEGAVSVAALANVVAGVTALALVPARRGAEEAAPPAAAAPAQTSSSHETAGLWAGLYLASGFCAISLEILWFRLMDVAVRSSAFTFGTVLSLYLLCAAAGCLAAAGLASRIEHPLRVFLICQCALLAYAGLAVVLLLRLPAGVPGLAWYDAQWSAPGLFVLGWSEDAVSLLRLYVILPLVLFGPSTVLMGFAFPMLQRAVQDDPRTSGRKVGLLQAANIAGCVAGSLVIGLLALNVLGTAGTLRLLLVCGMAFAAVGANFYGWRSRFTAAAVLLLAGFAALPSEHAFWLRFHGTRSAEAVVEEDASSVGAVVPEGGRWRVFVNGRTHSWLPFGGIHTRLGALPALVHAAPLDVAIIGLGSGDTAWAAGCRAETRRLRVYEISGPQPRILARISGREPLPDLRGLLADPRLQLVVADGRKALADSETTYDIIEADGLVPEVAYSGTLYSLEFFRMCARRLKPGGVMCTWAPTPRIVLSFLTAFPFVVGTEDILIGSREPIPLDLPGWLARARSPHVTRYLGAAAAEDLAGVLAGVRPLGVPGLSVPERHLNRDLYPRDEFRAP